jgi:hypothetical protein
MNTKFLSKLFRGRNNLMDLDVDGKLILKFIVHK